MTEDSPSDHDRGHSTDLLTDSAEETNPGTLPLVGGAILLLSAVRSLLRGQLRSIPIGFAGAGLLGYGLRKRRDGEGAAFDPIESIEDDADADGDARSAIEFVDDETDPSSPRSKPDVESADDDDPRRNTAGDESVEIDVSESATAEEVSEATGPDPEQAQPSQTEGTEPEATPGEETSAETAANERDDAAGETDEDDATETAGDDETEGTGGDDEGDDTTEDDDTGT